MFRFFTFIILLVASCNILAHRIWRLPTTIIPQSYQIKIHPNIDEETFTGRVIITVEVKDHTDEIVLHSENLNISKVYVDYQDNFKHETNEDTSLLTITHENGNVIYAGEHIISIDFDGSLSCGKVKNGLCKIPYGNESEPMGYIVVSDSEPSYARRIFPCFDEPHLKAKFSVRIVTPNDTYTALSNMNSMGTYETSYGVIYDFATTIPLSTYMVTFIITDYPYRETIWRNGNRSIPVRVYSPFNEEDILHVFPLETTLLFLNYFSNYTGIPYDFPKLYMIEYNRTSAASENWGMITMKNGLLSLQQSIYNKWQISVILAHEIAHMWFGNLITNDWWNDIWLQEGFASFFGEKAMKTVFASERFAESPFISYKLLMVDRNTSLPVVRQLESVPDIERHFRDMIYVKGSKIVSMLELVLGEDIFRQCIKKYLETYAYKTVTTGKFIEIVEEFAPHINVRGFLESWLFQNRYPIIYVEEEDENGTTFKLKQSSFSCHRQNETSNALDYKWTIPLTFITSNNFTHKTFWFDRDQDSVTIEIPNVRWVLFNPRHMALYRFNYTERMVQRLIDHMEELERAHKNMLLVELHHLFTSGDNHCGNILKFIGKYRTEVYEEDMYIVISFLNQLKRYLLKYNTELVPRFYKFVHDVATRNGKNLPDYYYVTRLEDMKRGNVTTIMETPDVKDKMPICIRWLEENLPEWKRGDILS